MTDLAAFIEERPKTELHLHLEGAWTTSGSSGSTTASIAWRTTRWWRGSAATVSG
jgi:hypothetical protein